MKRFEFSLMVMLCLWASSVLAIDVKDVEWGFDGRVMPSEFNLLSVYVDNPSDEPFEGQLVLQRKGFGTNDIGAKLVEEIYLAPFATRWVQFFPYCDGQSNWELKWGEQRHPVPQPRTGTHEPVLLQRSDGVTRSGRGLRQFPEELFPISGSATATLRVIIIGHTPRWEAPRRQAFMDWLKLGGVVHLLKKSDGEYPAFEKELAELNSPLKAQQFDKGVVFRHNLTADEITPKTLKTIATTRKRYRETQNGRILDPDPETTKKPSTKPDPQKTWSERYSIYQEEGELFFEPLKNMTNPNHNWQLIYLLSFLYIALIFPGCFILGRKRLHYMVTYGAILAGVVVFSVIFLMVGRRGYGEESAVYSVAIAEQLEKDQWDVEQFSNIFATSGDTYEVSHVGTGRLYSTCTTSEAVNGLIDNGVEGKFTVDIPPFSNRSFASRMKVRFPAPQITTISLEANQSLNRFDIRIDPAYFKKPIKAFVQYRDRFHKLDYTPDTGLFSAARVSLNVETFLSFGNGGNFVGVGWGMAQNDDDIDKRKIFQGLWKSLTARHLGIIPGRLQTDIAVPKDRVRLFVFDEAPDQLHVDNKRFAKHVTLVLYVVDVLRNQNP